MNAASALLALLVALGIAVIGAIDYLTGTEIRIFPLYLLPLVIAAWYLPLTASLFAALLATATWAGTQWMAGGGYSQEWIWAINILAQALIFLGGVLLIAQLHAVVRSEQAAARTDPLTGLPNSRSFYERVGSVLAVCHRNAQPATLAYIDLDNFKNVNDARGHQAGDHLLKKVADVINESLRSSDVAARVGGDEFVVLLPETDEDAARTALEKMRTRLERNADFRENDVTASIGAVSYMPAPPDVTRMVKAADRIMYRVKAAQKNQVIVQGMDAR